MRKSVAVVVGAVLAWLPGERCFAQAARFDVPPECGDEAAFSSELARLAGTDAERARPALLRITRAGDGAYRLTLVAGGRTRELEHADCRVLLRSAAVIAAASVKAEAAVAPAPAAPPAGAPVRSPRAAPSAQPLEANTPRGTASASLAAGVGASAGFVP
jgi:hypothetical protein